MLDIAWLMIYAVRMALGIERANHRLLSSCLAARALSWLCAGVFLVACSDNRDDKEQSVGEANVFLTDANNYTSTTSLDLGTLELAAGEDIDVCWDQVNKDLLCHDMDPKLDVDLVSLIRFKDKPEPKLEEQLAAGELSMSDPDLDFYFQLKTNHETTCTKLSQLQGSGGGDAPKVNPETDFVAGAEFTYMLRVGEGTVPTVGTQSLTILKPTSSSEETTANVPAACGESNILTFTANLESAKTVSIPADGPWVVDWSQMEHDGSGNTISFTGIDSVILGFYEGKTVEYIQENIKDLEIIKTTLWEVETSGKRKVDLAATRERTEDGSPGDRFSGFTSTDGVWVVGLMCSSCQSPAPVVLAVLDPQA